jgi:hypothetical protein
MSEQKTSYLSDIMKRTPNKTAKLNKAIALKRLELNLKRQSYRALGLTDKEIDDIFRQSANTNVP